MRDISTSGASFLTRVELGEGERINLTIQLTRDPDGTTVDTTAKVVRVEAFEPERSDVWNCQIAVRFEVPLEGVDDEIAQLAERLERAGLPW